MLVVSTSLAACGGDDGGNDGADGNPAGEALVCDTLGEESYRYEAVGVLRIEELSDEPETLAPGEQIYTAFTFTETVEGRVDGNGQTAVRMANATGNIEPAILHMIELNDGRGFLAVGDGGTWQEVDLSTESLFIRHRPVEICDALAPDIDVSQLGDGEAEEVNGISSHRYTFNGLPSEFFVRNSDFGPGTDIAQLAESIDGQIWVADSGNFLTKVEISGRGFYETGQPVSADITFEISDVGSDIDVGPPESATAGA